MKLQRAIWCCAVTFLALIPLRTLPGADEYLEEFSGVRDGSLPSSWTIISGTWTVRDGTLTGEDREGEGRVVLSDVPRVDFSFEADVTLEWVAEPSRWVALTFAESPAGESSHQTFTVRQKTEASNGLEHAVRLRQGGWRVRLARSYRKSLELNETVHLEARAAGGRVRGFIDGELVLDSPFAADAGAGRLGLQVSGARAVFDNLRVRPLSPAEVEALRVPREPHRELVIIAHGGASKVAPENTMTAFERAFDSGAEGCEFDVYRTADDQLVLFHDRTLDRTTDFLTVYGKDSGKESKVEALTLAELRRLDAGAWKSPRFRGEKIPTLLEALEYMRGKITPVVEIKPDDIGRQVADVVREAGMAEEVFVLSCSPQAIRDVQSALSEVPTGLLLGEEGAINPHERARDHVRRAREAGASAVVCNYRSVAPEYLREMHRRAMTVWVYTVDTPALLAMLRDMGVDGIITNVPAEALRIRAAPRTAEGIEKEVAGTRSRAAPVSPQRRIDIIAGEIPVLEFARYYSDALGLPLIGEGGNQAWVPEKIVLPATVRDADPELVKALLEANGYRVAERRLKDGRLVVFMSMARTAAERRTPRATPIVTVGSESKSRRVPASRRRVRRARGPEGEYLEYAGLTLTAVPEILLAQTDLRSGTAVLVEWRNVENSPPGTLSSVLRRYDIVTHVASEHVKSPADFKRKIEKTTPGSRHYLHVLRRGRTLLIPFER